MEIFVWLKVTDKASLSRLILSWDKKHTVHSIPVSYKYVHRNTPYSQRS